MKEHALHVALATLLMTTVGTTAKAQQKLMIYRNGNVQYSIPINDIDSMVVREDSDITPDEPQMQTPIQFTGRIGKAGQTRAAADNYSLPFNTAMVYGKKYMAAGLSFGSKQEKVVFPGTLCKTESNPWSCVETKYWDNAAESYTFWTVSGDEVTMTDKQAQVRVSNENIGGLYYSDKKDVTPGEYVQPVEFQMNPLAANIRFMVYETVPGYSARITGFRDKDNNQCSAPAICGNFVSSATAEITYEDSEAATRATSTNNYPRIGFTDITTTDNIQFAPLEDGTLGTSSSTATVIGITSVIPAASGTDMTITADIQLCSSDGSGEIINIMNASATIPMAFANWRKGCRYTYILKLRDNYSDPDNGGFFKLDLDALAVEEGNTETVTTFTR